MWRIVQVFSRFNFSNVGKKYIALDYRNVLNINRIIELKVEKTIPCWLGLTDTHVCQILYMKKELDFNSLGVNYFFTYSKGHGNMTESIEYISVYFHTKNSLQDASEFKENIDRLRKNPSIDI